jgi:hypothetical protein
MGILPWRKPGPRLLWPAHKSTRPKPDSGQSRPVLQPMWPAWSWQLRWGEGGLGYKMSSVRGTVRVNPNHTAPLGTTATSSPSSVTSPTLVDLSSPDLILSLLLLQVLVLRWPPSMPNHTSSLVFYLGAAPLPPPLLNDLARPSSSTTRALGLC